MNGSLTYRDLDDLREIAARARRATVWLDDQIKWPNKALASTYQDQLKQLREILTGKVEPQ